MPTPLFPTQITDLPAFDGPFDAHRLVAEGCDVLFASYPAGTSIADHEHDSENVGVVLRGELTLLVEGSQQRFGPGEWYHVAPHQVHAAVFDVETAEIEFW